MTLPAEEGGRGISPEVVGRLTLYQVRLYLADAKSIGGVQKMSPAEAKAAVARRRAQLKKTQDAED